MALSRKDVAYALAPGLVVGIVLWILYGFVEGLLAFGVLAGVNVAFF